MPSRILVSACLLGEAVRYDGGARPLCHSALARWQAEGRVVAVCPELIGGFCVPRRPAEIADGRSGEDVLAGRARVVDTSGADVTEGFLAGARAALRIARAQNCHFALLIDGSPSCGSSLIYDGSFDGRKHAAIGVTSALLRANGIEVFADHEIDALAARLGSS
ncbi:DUF523 domain-containing protein [Afifella marina]|uniref:Uncharacterized conserved protein YbbK, DUF523 family n=1 Tax=Afifella marina DSM 2698 TaxID=1120955 RepID=A0A1G5MDV4_AFIMA|nr:DUF523 domain-containing protein [Afifella marina]MBK1622664.1 DUF523 domain-containing protein [Afifella marina DSM 2698]MBK1625659.1 DUF523 domain-containing protein [Afifella marina]MBK5917482.1 purine-nucleoside phosphorylase [Afifella marina]RAI23422.1 purine-nucleoside phosphorylase [Afifella marina DSM 2698]SCZ22560.1 Uncharacterized conserved protein YbbK, DUF523 family [Afifella marina DSM 2698]